MSKHSAGRKPRWGRVVAFSLVTVAIAAIAYFAGLTFGPWEPRAAPATSAPASVVAAREAEDRARVEAQETQRAERLRTASDLMAPVPPGARPLSALAGGECVASFEAGAAEVEVVDCAVPHAAQLVRLAPLDGAGDPAQPYPGEIWFTERVGIFCNAAQVLDLPGIAGRDDVRIQAVFPSEGDWQAGAIRAGCWVLAPDAQSFDASVL